MEVYLVTGGAGFIGSHFIRHLFQTRTRLKVINVDKLTYAGNLLNLGEVAGRGDYSFVQEDISKIEVIDGIFQNYSPSYVINFAAETHVDRSIKDSFPFVKTNVLGTQALLQASLSCDIKKFLQISTDEVYGSLGLGDNPLREGSPLNPSSPYAASKGAADLLVGSYNKTYGLNTNITRCTNNYGSHQYPEKLIPLFIKNCLENRPLPLYGDGKNRRQWLHVDDHCRALDLILHQGIPGEIYNIGSGNEKENLDIARFIQRTIRDLSPGLQKRGSYSEIEFVEDRKGHDRRYAVSWDKLREELGWFPLKPWEEGLREAIGWYLKQNI